MGIPLKRLFFSFIVAFFILALPFESSAQTEPDPSQKKGIGEIIISYSPVCHHPAYFAGGHLGYMVGRNLFLGAGAHVLTNRIPFDWSGDPGRLSLEFFYAGICSNYRIELLGRIYLTVGALAGAGYITYSPEPLTENDSSLRNTCIICEPSIQLFMKVYRHFHFGAGFDYRIALGVEHAVFDDSDFSEPVLHIIARVLL